ncbi:MAG: hypothetical protein JWM57_2644 [Phycisphaerales bacterium]|nr:hypothetical protein [Phycisphaerales bacterium]
MGRASIISAGRTAGVLSLALLMLCATAVAKPGSRPGTKGKYDLVFYGSFKGTGTAKINPAHLTLDADLTSDTGPAGKLDVPKLQIDDGRFNGTGTLGGQPVDVSGRVDAPEGGIVKIARISVTLRTPDGRVSRGFGELQ